MLVLDARLRLGQHRECCVDAEQLAEEHPYREDIRAIHMRALYRSGRQTESLAVYRRTRKLLVEELGIDPGPELSALHRQILDQDPARDAPGVRAARTSVLEASLVTDNLRSERNVFVDRPEVEAIVDSIEPERVVTAVGMGGIGKSRCVSAVARRCQGDVVAADGVWVVDPRRCLMNRMGSLLRWPMRWGWGRRPPSRQRSRAISRTGRRSSCSTTASTLPTVRAASSRTSVPVPRRRCSRRSPFGWVLRCCSCSLRPRAYGWLMASQQHRSPSVREADMAEGRGNGK
jgi:hypothetical protein